MKNKNPIFAVALLTAIAGSAQADSHLFTAGYEDCRVSEANSGRYGPTVWIFGKEILPAQLHPASQKRETCTKLTVQANGLLSQQPAPQGSDPAQGQCSTAGGLLIKADGSGYMLIERKSRTDGSNNNPGEPDGNLENEAWVYESMPEPVNFVATEFINDNTEFDNAENGILICRP